MAFFDKLNDLAKNIGDKTNDAIETTKLNSKISTERSAAGEDLKKIGEFYYAKYAETGEAAPEILEFCHSAKAHYDAMAEARVEIDRIKAENEAEKAAPAVPVHTASGIACAACGKVNSPGTKFCCECGGKLEAPAAPQTKTCPECGAAVAGGLRFCGECGARLEG